MSDSGIQVTPEDRERLAKTKFGEWFDEFFEKKFEEAFEKKSQARRQQQTSAQNGDPSHTEPARSQQQPQRKRSLLETCLTDTFGF